MNDNEKKTEIPLLKSEADNLFREQKYENAAETYGKAIAMLEQLMLR